MDPKRIREYRTLILLLAMSKRKSYCVSFKLKAVETAEKNQKKLQQENLAWILEPAPFKRRTRFNAGLKLAGRK